MKVPQETKPGDAGEREADLKHFLDLKVRISRLRMMKTRLRYCSVDGT